ncbi:MAG: ornithine carbamoyltransferase [Polyangiaceae bacterium]|nr:ornithine carbamoyltransferase [Polyangiaceae bacterium]
MPRHLLTLTDLGRDGLIRILELAERFRTRRGRPGAELPLVGKTVALVFEKPSTRTRVSLEVAVHELGGHPLVLTKSGSQMDRGEPVKDMARVLTRMVHAITFRTGGVERLHEMVTHCTVPVLNALTDQDHPMQLLADLQTVLRVRKRLGGLKFAWVGDGNNMANSWIEAAGVLGLDLVLACPDGYLPAPERVSRACAAGGNVRVVTDPAAATEGAHVISTDVFASMGQEAEQQARLRVFAGYRLTRDLLKRAASDVVVLHCLPAHRGEEIDEEVLEGPHSHVWEQAEDRLHSAKAALVWAMERDG